MSNGTIPSKIPGEEYPEEEEQAPIFNEQQLGQMIINVASRIGRKRTKKGKWQDTEYTELLTADVTTAFLDEGSLSVLRNIEALESMILSFAEAHNISMAESYNFIGNVHNSLVVSSKATGEGSRVAKSQYVEEKLKAKYWDERKNQSKLEKGLSGLLGRKGGGDF